MRTIVRGVAAAAVVFGVFGSGTAEAKDLTGRLGAGYENTLVAGFSPFSASSSSVAVRYYVNQQVMINGQLGFSSFDPDAEGADSESNFGIGIGGGFVFVDEPNMNVFGLGQLQFGSVAGQDPTTGESESKTALGLRLGLGMEFFFVGLPNLGFTTAFGLSYESVADAGSSIAIGGGDFATFGIRYYFGGPTTSS